MTRRHIAAGLLTIAVAGCGDGKDSTPRKTAKAPKAAAAPTLGVDAPGLIAFHRFTEEAQTTAAIWTMKPDGMGEKQITHPPEGEIDDQPALSVDGKKLAYEYCTDACHVFVMDTDGGHRKEIKLRCPPRPICDMTGPAWGPDGRLVLNRSYGRPSDAETPGHTIERSELVVADADGSNPRVVIAAKPFDADLGRPVWSPDGTRIAYEDTHQTKSGGVRIALAIVSADGGRPHRITPFSLGAGDGPDWSPDGKWISFRTHDDVEGSPSDLEVIHPDGSGRRNLTHYGSSGNTPGSSSFSPDGQWLVFTGQHDGGPADVFLIRTNGTDLRPLTRTKLWDSAPEWSR